jgi:hypothetical protein
MNTTDLEFYHGTSAHAAARILGGEADPITQLRAREFVQQLWPPIAKTAGSLAKMADLFIRAGSSYYTSAPIALQNVCDGYNGSTFSYGNFCVTLGLKKACRYTLRSRTGSERLLFIEEGLKVLRMIDSGFADDLCGSYPELMAQYGHPQHPVVLALMGLEMHRLADENGGSLNPSLIATHIEWVKKGNALDPSFRVENVTKDDIAFVYDLKMLENENAETVTEDELNNCLSSPAQWISSFNAAACG